MRRTDFNNHSANLTISNN